MAEEGDKATAAAEAGGGAAATAAAGGGGGGGGGGAEEESVKLFVGQVPKQMTEDELAAMFSAVAVVDEVTLIRDKATKASRGPRSVRGNFFFPFPTLHSQRNAALLFRSGARDLGLRRGEGSESGSSPSPSPSRGRAPTEFDLGVKEFELLAFPPVGPQGFPGVSCFSWRFMRNVVGNFGCSWPISVSG